MIENARPHPQGNGGAISLCSKQLWDGGAVDESQQLHVSLTEKDEIKLIRDASSFIVATPPLRHVLAQAEGTRLQGRLTRHHVDAQKDTPTTNLSPWTELALSGLNARL